jgi:hypothetical protein
LLVKATCFKLMQKQNYYKKCLSKLKFICEFVMHIFYVKANKYCFYIG